MVSYGDLNLQRDDGVAVLYRRIQVAANKVCTQVNGRMPQVIQRERECAADATSRAVAKVGVPALTTLHLARTQKAANAVRLGLPSARDSSPYAIAPRSACAISTRMHRGRAEHRRSSLR